MLRFRRVAPKEHCFSAGDVQGGYSLLRAGRQAPLRLQLRRERIATHVESNIAVPDGTSQLRFEFEVTGKPDIKSGQGGAGRAPSFTSTANLSDRVTFLSRCHSPLGLPAASSAAPTRLAGLGQSTNRRSSSPARLYSSDRGRERRAHQGRRGHAAYASGAAVNG